jgi:HEAT repeat protein
MQVFGTIRRLVGRGLGIAAMALTLARAEHCRAEQLRPYDPVDALRQALRVPVIDPARNPQELTARRDLLTRRVAALRGPGDFRRALLLNEWQSDQDPKIQDIDLTIRRELAQRLERALRTAMLSSDPAARLGAATMLGEMGSTVRSGSEGSSGLTDRTIVDPTVVRAFPAFARLLMPDLVKLTRDGNPAVEAAASRALSNITPDPKVAASTLSQVLRSADVTVRRAAAAALANLVQKSPVKSRVAPGLEPSPAELVQMATAVVPVAGRGLTDGDARVRRSCVQALSAAAVAMGDVLPGPTGDLGALRGPRPGPEEERTEVTPLATALEAQAPALARTTEDPDPQVRQLSCRALEDMAAARTRTAHPSDVIPLPPPAPAPTPPKEKQTRRPGRKRADDIRLVSAEAPPKDAPDSLMRGLQGTLPAAAARLGDPFVRVRLAALDFMETMGPDAASAAGAVVGALADPCLFVRWAAARTLGRIGPVNVAESVPALARLLEDPDLDVRLATAAVLERYGPQARAAVPALTAAVGRGDAEIRVAVLRAIEAVGADAEPAIPAVTEALTHPDLRVRRAAAEALGSFGPAARSAQDALRRTLNDSVDEVRKAASDALLDILIPAGAADQKPEPPIAPPVPAKDDKQP